MLTADQAATRARYCALLRNRDRAAGFGPITARRPLLAAAAAWIRKRLG